MVARCAQCALPGCMSQPRQDSPHQWLWDERGILGMPFTWLWRLLTSIMSMIPTVPFSAPSLLCTWCHVETNHGLSPMLPFLIKKGKQQWAAQSCASTCDKHHFSNAYLYVNSHDSPLFKANLVFPIYANFVLTWLWQSQPNTVFKKKKIHLFELHWHYWRHNWLHRSLASKSKRF